MNQELEEHLELGGVKISDRLVFQPGDFDQIADVIQQVAVISAARANSVLNAWLDRQRVVYGLSDSGVSNAWTNQRTPIDTHRAILCCIERIEPKKHDCRPAWGASITATKSDAIDTVTIASSCSVCGKQIRATWSPV